MNDKKKSVHEGEDSPSASDEASKVIKKGKARLIVAENEPNDQSASPQQPREIRPEPRLMGGKSQVEVDAVAEPEEEEVMRLERAIDPGKERIKVDKAKFEKLEERPDEAEKQEEQWGESKHTGAGALLAGGALVIVLVIGAVAMRGFFLGDTERVNLAPGRRALEEQASPFEGSPEKWFRDRSGKLSRDGLKVLASFMEETDDQGRSQWVRNPEFFLEQSQNWKVDVNPIIRDDSKGKWNVSHIDDIGYVTWQTRNQEYMPFRVYFTRQGDAMKIDWAATTAWSEVSLEAMAAAGKKRAGAANRIQREAGVVAAVELSPRPKSDLSEKVYTDSVIVRSMIRKRDEFYAGIYNDEEYSAYMLLSSDKMHHMWGYAPKGSELDRQLKEVLDHGSFVVKLKKDRRVTLRVRINEKEALPKQLELLELVHPEWVTP